MCSCSSSFVSIVLATATADKQDGGAEEDGKLTKAELQQFVTTKKLPERWNFNKHFVSYGLICDIFETLDELNKPQYEITESCNLLCKKNNLGSVIKHVGNFKNKILRFFSKPCNNPKSIFDSFYIKAENDDCLCQYCTDANISLQLLENMMTLFNDSKNQPDSFDVKTEEETLSRSSLTNGIVLELGEARQQLGATWAEFKFWLCQLWGIDKCIDPSNLRTTIENLKGKKSKLVKRQKHDDLDDLKETLFVLPGYTKQEKRGNNHNKSVQDYDDSLKKQELFEEKSALRECTCTISNLIEVIQESEERSEMLEQALWETARDKNKIENEAKKKQNKLKQKQASLEDVLKKLEKLNRLKPSNVNRKLKRTEKRIQELENKLDKSRTELQKKETDLQNKDMEIEELLETSAELEINLEEKDEEVDDLGIENAALLIELDKAMTEKLREQKSKYYFKNKVKNPAEQDDLNLSKINELKTQIKQLENEKLELEEKVHDFMNSNDIVTFENGRYTDNIWMVYEDLMCLGIGM